MEEKNNERKKILLVIAIFIVLIAISVGGVYAYFSARATNSGDTITGRTLDINGTTLTIRADRVDLEPDPVPLSDDLVPAKFGVEPTEVTTTEVNRALSKQCAGGGYTGCHVWKVTATSSIDIPSANIKLNLSLSGVTDKDQWSYVVYRGTDTNSETILNKGLINTTFPNSNRTLDIHNGASLTAGTPAIYYVMIYLNNTNSIQNDGVNDNTTDERGTYNGTVTLEAMGGEVYVNFYEPESTDASFFEYTIENNEVTITRYKPKSSVTYTVSDQSACESYLENVGLSSEQATALCAGGALENGMTLGDAIAEGDIPSSDYETAGLSNVVITPAPTDVIIPSTIEGYPVVKIKGGILNTVTGRYANAPFQNAGLTSVKIPSSVTSIGAGAFWDNPLTLITIENENASIGNCAFGENPPLDEPFLSNYVCVISSGSGGGQTS